jgi:L1 cell adhesion molecule like protein
VFFSSTEIAALIFRHLKRLAERHLDRRIEDAVISIPVMFNDSQRQATIDAAKIAGFDNVRLISSPSAVALAYDSKHRKKDVGKNIIIVDLGSGALDVALVNVEDGLVELHAVAGSSHFGGNDIDEHIAQYVAKEFNKQFNLDVTKNARAMYRLRRSCERAKRNLSTMTEDTIEIDSLMAGHDLKFTLKRSELEMLCLDQLKLVLKHIERVLADSKLNSDQVDDIVLVGGCSAIPKLKELIQEFFGGKELNASMHPLESVVEGAALLAAMKIFPQSDPAASYIDDMFLIDVIPYSVGLETAGAVMTVLIARNNSIPAKRSQTFSTVQGYVEKTTLSIYEGENASTRHNHLVRAKLLAYSLIPL